MAEFISCKEAQIPIFKELGKSTFNEDTGKLKPAGVGQVAKGSYNDFYVNEAERPRGAAEQGLGQPNHPWCLQGAAPTGAAEELKAENA